MKSGFALLVMLSLSLLLPSKAQASTSCSATLTNVQLGAVDPFSGTVDASGTLNYSCTITTILSSSKIRLCFSIGAGAQGGGNLAPRQMSSGGNLLYFNLYKDAAHSQIWGTRSDAYGEVGATLVVGALLGSATASGSFTVYGRVPSGQTGLVPGNYSNLFSGSHTELIYRYNEFALGLLDYPASCSAGGNGGSSGTFAFTASASVSASCDPAFTVNNLNFGTRGLLNSNIDTAANINPRCTNTTPYQIGLNNGLNANGSIRRMKSAANGYVTYELYRDSGHAQRWGNIQNVDTVSGTGSGSAQSVPMYGRVPVQSPAPAAGVYSDTVTVTIYY